MYKCDFCNADFKGQKGLDHHRYFHLVTDCGLASEVYKIERKNSELESSVKILQKELSEKDTEIKLLKERLTKQFSLALVFSKILQDKFNLDLSKLYDEEDGNIDFYNYESEEVSINVHDYVRGSEGITRKYNITRKKKRKEKISEEESKPKSVYKSLKKEELTFENPRERDDHVKQVEENLENISMQNFNVIVKETKTALEQLIKRISKERVYKKILVEIRNLRKKLLGKLPIQEYIDLVNFQTNVLKTMLQNKSDPKKATSLIPFSLTPLDQRLIRYEKYYESYLEVDEIQFFGSALTVNISHSYPKRYTPFSFQEVFQRINSYGLALFSIRELLQKSLINPFGFSNIVFLPKNETENVDKFHFYILESINENQIRKWKMECRLYEFSHILAHSLKEMCIALFRRIYFDIYNDNVYRENYTSNSYATKMDCDQLRTNLVFLSSPKEFCNSLRDIISEKCVIQPSNRDKFSLIKDDLNLRKIFENEKNKDEYKLETVKRLFDGLTEDAARKLISPL